MQISQERNSKSENVVESPALVGGFTFHPLFDPLILLHLTNISRNGATAALSHQKPKWVEQKTMLKSDDCLRNTLLTIPAEIACDAHRMADERISLKKLIHHHFFKRNEKHL